MNTAYRLTATFSLILLILSGCSSTTTKVDQFFFIEWGFIEENEKTLMHVTLDLKQVPKDMATLESIELTGIPRETIDKIEIVSYTSDQSIESWNNQDKYSFPLSINEGKEYTILVYLNDESINKVTGVEFIFKDSSYTYSFTD